jgi:hypothetical protein
MLAIATDHWDLERWVGRAPDHGHRTDDSGLLLQEHEQLSEVKIVEDLLTVVEANSAFSVVQLFKRAKLKARHLVLE